MARQDKFDEAVVEEEDTGFELNNKWFLIFLYIRLECVYFHDKSK